MSLKVNKDNIYVIVQNGRYELSEKIGDFMEGDFTIFIRAKIIREYLEIEKEVFLFSRNGKHSGLSVFLDKEDKLWVQCVYWLIDGNDQPIYMQIRQFIPKESENSFNNYIITCDDKLKKIYFYINGNKLDEIDYSNKKKEDYSNSFFWLGCGDMLVEDEKYNGVGNFEYDVFIGLNKCLDIRDIYKIGNNYKTKYLKIDTEYGLPILINEIPYKDNIKIFCDFDYKNIYKIWNMVDNGVFFQKYIKGNIFF